MADNDDVSGASRRDDAPDDVTRPVLPPEPAPVQATTAPAAQPVLKPRWRDRAWGFRELLVVALAALLVGGLLGGGVVALADGDDRDGRFHRMGPWGPGGDVPPGWRKHHFDDGGPRWRGYDDFPDRPMMPQQPQAPSGTPTPTPSTDASP